MWRLSGLLLLLVTGSLQDYSPYNDRNRITHILMRSPQSCGLKTYPGIQKFIDSQFTDNYEFTLKYGRRVPFLSFQDINENELGRVYLNESTTPEDIEGLIKEADVEKY